MTLSSQMTDESRARKNSWKWGQVKLGKALTRVFQEGWKLEDVVTWPFPQEKATAETGEGVPGRRSALVAQARTLEPDTRHQLAILGT